MANKKKTTKSKKMTKKYDYESTNLRWDRTRHAEIKKAAEEAGVGRVSDFIKMLVAKVVPPKSKKKKV